MPLPHLVSAIVGLDKQLTVLDRRARVHRRRLRPSRRHGVQFKARSSRSNHYAEDDGWRRREGAPSPPDRSSVVVESESESVAVKDGIRVALEGVHIEDKEETQPTLPRYIEGWPVRDAPTMAPRQERGRRERSIEDQGHGHGHKNRVLSGQEAVVWPLQWWRGSGSPDEESHVDTEEGNDADESDVGPDETEVDMDESSANGSQIGLGLRHLSLGKLDSDRPRSTTMGDSSPLTSSASSPTTPSQHRI